MKKSVSASELYKYFENETNKRKYEPYFLLLLEHLYFLCNWLNGSFSIAFSILDNTLILWSSLLKMKSKIITMKKK